MIALNYDQFYFCKTEKMLDYNGCDADNNNWRRCVEIIGSGKCNGAERLYRIKVI